MKACTDQATIEATALALRQLVYGPITQVSWEQVRDNWMRPDSIRWLREQVRAEEAKHKQP